MLVRVFGGKITKEEIQEEVTKNGYEVKKWGYVGNMIITNGKAYGWKKSDYRASENAFYECKYKELDVYSIAENAIKLGEGESYFTYA